MLASSGSQCTHALNVQGVGVDAPRDDDLYYRLLISEAFYVGGIGVGAAAEVISAEDLAAAEPDRCNCRTFGSCPRLN